MSEVYVNLQHCRALGICNSGLRRFCKQNDLDLRDFRDGKMTISKLRARGDEFWSGKLEALILSEEAD